jgi:hypothetical protein
MKKRTLHLSILVVSLLAIATPCYAGPATLILTDLNTHATVTIFDGGAGDLNSAVGVITFIGSLPANNGVASVWWMNVTTGITKPALGSPVQPEMDLASINVNSGGAGLLQIQFSDTGFGPITNGIFSAGVGGNTSGHVTYDAYLDATRITSLGPFGPGAFNGTTSSAPQTSASYSLTQSVIFSHAYGGVSGLNATLTATASVPEPSMIILLGIALSLVTLLAWRSKT